MLESSVEKAITGLNNPVMYLAAIAIICIVVYAIRTKGGNQSSKSTSTPISVPQVSYKQQNCSIEIQKALINLQQLIMTEIDHMRKAKHDDNQDLYKILNDHVLLMEKLLDRIEEIHIAVHDK